MWVTIGVLEGLRLFEQRQIYQAAPNSVTQSEIQLNLSTTAIFGTEELAIVERFKQESMYGLSAKKVAVEERWPLWRGGC